jgi:hypothetical protein
LFPFRELHGLQQGSRLLSVCPNPLNFYLERLR